MRNGLLLPPVNQVVAAVFERCHPGRRTGTGCELKDIFASFNCYWTADSDILSLERKFPLSLNC